MAHLAFAAGATQALGPHLAGGAAAHVAEHGRLVVQRELHDLEALHEAGHRARGHQPIEHRLQQVRQPALQAPQVHPPDLRRSARSCWSVCTGSICSNADIGTACCA